MSTPSQTPRSPTEFIHSMTGVSRRVVSDLYYFLLSTSWSRLLLVAAVGYVLINVCFAILYMLGGDCISGVSPGDFWDDFFFSIQTFSTIGYGAMSPTTSYAHVLVTLESFLGLVAVAVGTGVVFAKFSRPSARVSFSEYLVVNERNGVPCLQFRLANERKNSIFDAHIRLSVILDDVTEEGHHMRRVISLKLEAERTPMFTVNWIAIHRLDDQSPLQGLNNLCAMSRVHAIIATFHGIDATFLSTVQGHRLYSAADIKFGHQFSDMLEYREDGRIVVHHERLHDIAPA